MTNMSQSEYQPDYISIPGESLLETLEAIGMSQSELAERSGRPIKTINEIVHGKAAITAETALQLEKILGVPASFWNNRERQYQEFMARKKEEGELREQLEWLKQIPVRAMINKDWIRGSQDNFQQLREVLAFFGVASPAQWKSVWTPKSVAFRISQTLESDLGALTAWLRKGELEAQKMECKPYDRKKFYDILPTIREMTLENPKDFISKLRNCCADVGVAVVFVPELPKTRAWGATRWLSPKKALIQLSLRYKSNDHFWFTLFHEAGHILHHGKRDFFLERKGLKNVKEDEANSFAANILISQEDLDSFIRHNRITKFTVRQFARRIGIAPGIVVGRLQKDHVIPQNRYNDLKRRYEWT